MPTYAHEQSGEAKENKKKEITYANVAPGVERSGEGK